MRAMGEGGSEAYFLIILLCEFNNFYLFLNLCMIDVARKLLEIYRIVLIFRAFVSLFSFKINNRCRDL